MRGPTWPHLAERDARTCLDLLALDYSMAAVARWAAGRYASLAGVPPVYVRRVLAGRRSFSDQRKVR